MNQSFVRRAGLLCAAASVVAAACTPSPLRLDVGSCFDDPPDLRAVTDVPIRDCASPHDNETFALRSLAFDEYPGDVAIERESEAACVEAFDAYVGVAYFESAYDVGWLSPSSDSWDVGDREIICFVFDPSGAKIIGSVRSASAA